MTVRVDTVLGHRGYRERIQRIQRGYSKRIQKEDTKDTMTGYKNETKRIQ